MTPNQLREACDEVKQALADQEEYLRSRCEASEAIKKEAHQLRARTVDGQTIWIFYDAERVLRGKPRESRLAVLKRWCYPDIPIPILCAWRGVVDPGKAEEIIRHVYKGE